MLRHKAPPGFPLLFEVQAEDTMQVASWSGGPGDRSLWRTVGFNTCLDSLLDGQVQICVLSMGRGIMLRVWLTATSPGWWE